MWLGFQGAQQADHRGGERRVSVQAVPNADPHDVLPHQGSQERMRHSFSVIFCSILYFFFFFKICNPIHESKRHRWLTWSLVAECAVGEPHWHREDHVTAVRGAGVARC